MNRTFKITVKEFLVIAILMMSGIFFGIYYGAQNYILSDMVINMARQHRELSYQNDILLGDVKFYKDFADLNTSYSVFPSDDLFSVVFYNANGLMDFTIYPSNDGWNIITWWDEYKYRFGDITPISESSLETHIMALPISMDLQSYLLTALEDFRLWNEPLYNEYICEIDD